MGKFKTIQPPLTSLKGVFHFVEPGQSLVIKSLFIVWDTKGINSILQEKINKFLCKTKMKSTLLPLYFYKCGILTVFFSSVAYTLINRTYSLISGQALQSGTLPYV